MESNKVKLATFSELYNFAKESNEIEDIRRAPTNEEIEELARFIHLPVMTIEDISKFVSVYQPNARLRDEYDLCVRIGRYFPPNGCPEMKAMLQEILDRNLGSWELHVEYENLHPYTDCNGRSGRALWAWKEKDLRQGFLLNFYYQTLARRNEPNRYSVRPSLYQKESDIVAPQIGNNGVRPEPIKVVYERVIGEVK